MPNWCYTSIVITTKNPDKTKLEDLAKKISDWSHKQFCDTGEGGFRDGWLGNIVGNSGIAHPLEANSPRCRGTLTSVYYEHEQINLSTETAWAPMMQMWQMIIDKYLPRAEIIYSAEETGCCFFCTNDPDVVGKYYIDIWEPPEEFEDEESEYEATEEYTVQFLQRVLKTDETDIDKLLEKAEEDEDSWFAVNKWQNCPISELN